MSASSRPTRRPNDRSPSARLTAVVDLPTPPLPDATAITWATPGMRWVFGCFDGPGRGDGAAVLAGSPPPSRSAVSVANTPVTPGTARTAFSAARRTFSMPRRFGRIDEDREHHPTARIDDDIGQAAGLDQSCAALIHGDVGQCLHHPLTCHRHDGPPWLRYLLCLHV